MTTDCRTNRRYKLWQALAATHPMFADEIYEREVKADYNHFGAFVPAEFGPVPLPDDDPKPRPRKRR